MSKIKCDVRKIVAELSEVNSRNEQKVVALISWNDRDETVDIRKFNTVDQIPLKGISLTYEETESLIYNLLASNEIEYDPERAMSIIENRKSEKVDLDSLMKGLDEPEYSRGPDGGIKIEPRDWEE